MSPLDDWLTAGDYATEADAVAALLAALGERWFRPHAEVPGRYLYTRPGTADTQPRADLILRPTAEAVASGWDLGPIGVEAKRSGVKLGPLVAQVLDYQGAVFYPSGIRSGRPSGTGVVPSVWALWPAGAPRGALDSILVQRNICTADIAATRGGPWVLFRSGGRNVLKVSAEGIAVGGLVAGAKRGAR